MNHYIPQTHKTQTITISTRDAIPRELAEPVNRNETLFLSA